MPQTNMSVKIDGATLSALLFNQLNQNKCGACQYGFLLGEKVEQIEDRISDSQIHTEKISSYTYIIGFLPWPSPGAVYSRSGCLNESALDKLLPNDQELIGWYSFRHQSSLRPSLKEMTLHRNLSTCKKFLGDPQDFYFFLCSSTIQPKGSTYTSNHGFFHHLKGSFKKIPMTVMNLGDTTRKDYRKRSNATLTHSSTIQGLFKKSRKDFVQTTGETEQVVKVDRLASSINKSLMSMYTKVSKSEMILGSLEKEVIDLRSQVEALEKEEMKHLFDNNEDLRKKQELEDSVRLERDCEAEEQSQLNKLIVDLGISSPDICISPVRVMSNSTHDSSQPDSLDLESFGNIDSSMEPGSSSEAILHGETTTSRVGRTSEKKVQAIEKTFGGNGNKTVGNIERASSKRVLKNSLQAGQNHTPLEKDPFACLGDVVQLNQDLKLPDRTRRQNQSTRDGKNVVTSSSKVIKSKVKTNGVNVKSNVSDESNSDDDKPLSLRRPSKNSSEQWNETQHIASSSPQY